MNTHLRSNGTRNVAPVPPMMPELGRKAQRVMLMTEDRILYCGLLGERAMAMLGAVTVYVSFGHPFTLHYGDGRSVEGMCVAVAPYVPHRIASDDPCIGMLHLEPEDLDLDALPWLAEGAAAAAELAKVAERTRALYASLVKGEAVDVMQGLDLDTPLFGGPLPRRRLDPRIAKVVERIRADPSASFTAEECAKYSCLSFSRFLHLFSAETGVTFRRFKSWQRARAMLRYVNHESTLTDVALEIGFPGSSHFSTTIRHTFGLKPRDMFAGARRLKLVLPTALS